MFQENHRIQYPQSLQIWNSYCHKPHFPEDLSVRRERFLKSAKSPWVLRHVAEKIGEAPGPKTLLKKNKIEIDRKIDR